MPIHAHGGHSWVRMGVGEHNWGWGHRKEARKTTYGHYRSWVYTLVARKLTKKKVWRGGARMVSGDKPGHTGHVLRPIGPN